MHRCHIDTKLLLSNSILLNRGESRHLKTVLRVQLGAAIQLFDGEGHTRNAVIESIGKSTISIAPTEEILLHSKPKCAIYLFVCISKGKRMAWTIEKAVELGASCIIPVISAHTIVRLSSGERKSKAERWQRVATDALRQCGGAWMPEIHIPVDFTDALKLIPDCSPVFTAALTDDAVAMRDTLRQMESPPDQAGWFVGPEGDFTMKELELLRSAGTKFVGLGANVLRAETAAVYGLCVLGCEWL